MDMLEVENLCVAIHGSIGKNPVLEDVNFVLEQGMIHGLVGQSGAGKTMMASALTGLLSKPARITKGRIWFKGREFDITDKKTWKHMRGQKIFMLFQCASQALNPSLTAGIQIAEVLGKGRRLFRKKDNQRVCELLEKVGLDSDTIYKYPFQLSGGMRQRVQIAMAIALEPDVLIADEPTTGLDSITQSDILNLISSLRADHGMSILFISHDLRAVSSISQQISVMHQGKLTETGNVQDIFKFPQSQYTRKLIYSLNEMESMSWQNRC